MKRKYKHACKEIERQNDDTMFNGLFPEYEQLLKNHKDLQLIKTHKDLCKEKKGLKQNLEIQSTTLENVERELFLVRESMGKRHMETN